MDQIKSGRCGAALPVSGGSFIYRHTYAAEPLILSVKDAHVAVSVVPASPLATDRELLNRGNEPESSERSYGP
jgi:hypothetical protein